MFNLPPLCVLLINWWRTYKRLIRSASLLSAANPSTDLFSLKQCNKALLYVNLLSSYWRESEARWGPSPPRSSAEHAETDSAKRRGWIAQNGEKNTASRQQDAHVPEKDGWWDSGNGEEGGIWNHSCVLWLKIPVLKQRLFVVLCPYHETGRNLLSVTARITYNCDDSWAMNITAFRILLCFCLCVGKRPLKVQRSIILLRC